MERKFTTFGMLEPKYNLSTLAWNKNIIVDLLIVASQPQDHVTFKNLKSLKLVKGLFNSFL